MPPKRAATSRATTSKTRSAKEPAKDKIETPQPRSKRGRPRKSVPKSPDLASEYSVERQLTLESDDDYESEAESLHSDALDEDEGLSTRSKKRKRGEKGASEKVAGKKSSPRKKRKKAGKGDEESDDDVELEDGQEVVGVVVQAPKDGRGSYYLLDSRVCVLTCLSVVPPGQISKNTINFLQQLKKPECNDREW